MVVRPLVLLALAAVAAVGCGHGEGRTKPAPEDTVAARFPLAALGDRPLCDRLLARTAAEAVTVDPEPRLRRKVIVSDLHVGPGDVDPRFAGIEDFYSEDAWAAFLARQAAAGPTDVIIAGDFIEFWQIASALGALPKTGDARQPASGPALAADQETSVRAAELAIAAHPGVFRALGQLLDGGDHRVIVVAGNHDADLLWPKVQLAVARAIHPRDPTRLLLVPGDAYEHGGVHVEHGHAFDAANRFATGFAPFGRDRDGRCRLQSSWGQVFVDQFYTETERQLPFIDNLYPESAAILWAMRDNPDPQRDVGAVLRFIDLVRTAETGAFNREAARSVLQAVLGTPEAPATGPSLSGVIDHLSDRLAGGDPDAATITDALLRLRLDPALSSLWRAMARAARALPDLAAAFDELKSVEPEALAHLRDELFGDPLQAAAARIVAGRPGIRVVVFGHTHDVGGQVLPIRAAGGAAGHYANTGSWISVASVAALRARGVTWDKLSLADRAMFPPSTTAVIVAYDGAAPRPPVLANAR